MPNFVDDNTDLPFPKYKLRSAPEGKDNQYIQAKDWNKLCQAAYDLREKILSLNEDLQNLDYLPSGSEIIAGAGLSGGGALATNPTISLPTTGVSAGTYDMPSFVVDDKGRVTSGTRLVFNARSFGAKGDGVTDDLTAVRAAIAAANIASASTGEQAVVLFPAGEYILGRDGTHSYSLDFQADNIVLQGVPGRSVLKHPLGMPNASVAMIRIDTRSGVVIRDLVIDGNWGGVEGVTTTQQGINHADQTTDGIHYDPKNYGIMIRGSRDILIENCQFRQTYGDGIWMGARSDSDFSQDYWTENVQIINCRFYMCARNAISLGAAQRRVTIERCETKSIFTTVIDSEPQSLWGHSRDVVIKNCDLHGWWDPVNGGSNNNIISMVGGVQSGKNYRSAALGWRIVDNRIYGGIYGATIIDAVIRGNRIIMAPNAEPGTYRSPIFLDHTLDDITIEDNFIYDAAPASTTLGSTHIGAIDIRDYPGDATRDAQPAGVRIRNNRIHARNGVHGIYVDSPGGFAYKDLQPVQAPTSGVATAVTATTLTHTGANWIAGRWKGWTVIMGSVCGLIEDNTVDTLTLTKGTTIPQVADNGWTTPLGELTTTPALGTYWITNISGLVDVEGNDIDCSYDGNPAGGDGIYAIADYAGGRVRIHNNKIKNCGASATGGLGRFGIYVSGGAADPALFLEITDNKFWDDQPVHSMSAGIRFANPESLTSLTKLIMHGNSLLGGVTTLYSGASTGVWLLRDGQPAEWTGFGSPEGVVTATIGSTYLRRDGSAGTVLYIKNSGTGSTGWVPAGGVAATGTIVCVAKASLADTDFLTIGDGFSAPKVYEFDVAGDGVTAGRIQVNVSADTTATQVGDRLKTAIETNQPALTVTNASGTLTVTHKIAGVVGNVTITENVANAGFTVTGMSGGVNPSR